MSKVTACVCVMVVLLVIQVATANGFSRDGPAKFMRWGKRGDAAFDTTDSIEPAASKILCELQTNGLYKCGVMYN